MTPSIIITTVPFGDPDPAPLRSLEAAAAAYTINPLGRKLQPAEVAGVIADHEIVIAGTEPITAEVMSQCPNLKAICRVGIGLDSVDLVEARRRGIAVSYTPDAPSPAVAELAIGLMIDAARGISRADAGLKQGQWTRRLGKRIDDCTIGVIGTGRIGARVIRHLAGGFPNARILAHDIAPDATLDAMVTWCSLADMLRQCDIISLHVPLTPETENLIADDELARMKPDAVLVNTARGGIVNEPALANALRRGVIGGAAVDVFCVEPYAGELAAAPNAVLTCHMGSMTQDCRARMEIEATDDAIRFARGQAMANPVPEGEYVLASRKGRER